MSAQTTVSGDRLLDRFYRWFMLRPALALALAVLAALVPFLNKPLNFDDPLFVWTAHHIQTHPADPYGFEVNWYGTPEPMWQVTKNPPLACYYLAIWAAVFGWSELALHAAMLLPALAVILGTHRLARHFCNRPALAAAVTLFTPVFLVSSTTLMSDVMMLAFWVWAMVFWIEGTERGAHWRMAAAGGLVSLAVLTKYFGVCLIPLLAIWSGTRRNRVWVWGAWLAVPVAVLIVYQLATRALYGRALFSDAGVYAASTQTSAGYSMLTSVITTLAFTGGCVAVVVFFSPLLWRRKGLALGAACAVLIAYPLFAAFKRVGPLEGSSPFFLAMQMAFWFAGGVGVLWLALADVRRRPDAGSWLLTLWVLGTFLFTAFFNWIINARSVLPMVPAVAILIARSLEQRREAGSNAGRMRLLVPLSLSAALAWWVAWSDFCLATAVRETTRQSHARYGNGAGNLWFQGHWGFQYYMEAYGAKAVDALRPAFKPGDHLATPSNNSNVQRLKELAATEPGQILVKGPRWLATVSTAVGAGFYASLWGPLPFAFGHVPPETVVVVDVTASRPAATVD